MSTPASPESLEHGPRPMPASQPVLLRALRWGLLATATLVVLFAGIGWLVSQSSGLIGGVLGAAMGGVFLVLTVGSIAFANRFVESPNFIVMFFAIVMGSWLLKFVIFIVAAVLLRDQPWLNPTVLFFGVVSAVVVSLVIDVVVIAKSRIPYVSES